MSERKLPDQIADFFIALIFIETLKAGDKLPPERQLADRLQVDRTSLRTALKILMRMNLIESVQGSGITILNMREHAGVDMLDNVLRIPEINLGSDLLIHTVRSTIQILPIMFIHAFKSFEEASRTNMVLIFQHQADRCKQGASSAELADFDIKLQDSVAKALDQSLVMMAANSSRRVRLMLFTMLYEQVDLQNHFKKQLAMIRKMIAGAITVDELERRYRQHIQKLADSLIRHLETLPRDSYLSTSPLKHLPEMVTIAVK